AAARGEETPIQLRFQGEGCSSVALAEGAIVELYGIALRRGAGGFEAELGALRQARSTHRGPNLLVVMPGGVAEAWIEGPWDEPR
ncbi:MAG: hypothetical protein JNM84_06920, partial [Planctomycetes bacterium]|nr:hypothetical protein [Planctomycetota bacterium]